MELDGELIGQIIYVQSEIDCDDGRKVSIMTFGPISIAPAYKRQGYGKQLLDYSMEKAREMGAGALPLPVILTFTASLALFRSKPGAYAMPTTRMRTISHQRIETRISWNDISGNYKDPEGYFVCEKDPEEFERFEATFPVKKSRSCRDSCFEQEE